MTVRANRIHADDDPPVRGLSRARLVNGKCFSFVFFFSAVIGILRVLCTLCTRIRVIEVCTACAPRYNRLSPELPRLHD